MNPPDKTYTPILSGHRLSTVEMLSNKVFREYDVRLTKQPVMI